MSIVTGNLEIHAAELDNIFHATFQNYYQKGKAPQQQQEKNDRINKSIFTQRLRKRAKLKIVNYGRNYGNHCRVPL